MNKIRHLLTIGLGLAFSIFSPITLATSTSAVILQGQVVRVSDGDSVTLQTQTGNIKIRLAGIDAPESKMPHGPEAKAHLVAMVLDQEVQALVHKKDRYGRTIATLMMNTKDVNLAMVQAGWAWHYKQYAGEQTTIDAATYAHAENKARALGVGLWQVQKPVPPWEWRHHRTTITKYALTKS